MLCRALLAAFAVSCTFKTVQAQRPTQIKDILCLLIINGLQKEDLDVNTLKKLQRHDVNIDDLNNEALRKNCEIPNTNSITKNTDLNKAVTQNSNPDKGVKQDQETKLPDSNQINTITNDVKPNNNPIVKDEDFEKFIHVWSMFSKLKEHVIESTTKNIESTSIVINKSVVNKRSDEKIANINKILQNYIDSQRITTDLPITTIDYDIIAQKIKDLLAKDNRDTEKSIQNDRANEDNYRRNFVKKGILQNASAETIHDLQKINDTTKNKNHHFLDTNVEYQTDSIYLLNDTSVTNIKVNKENPPYKKSVKNGINSLPEDIIRELSESVRAKVLLDLKTLIVTTTTTKEPTPTTLLETTTYKPTDITTTINAKDENKGNSAKDVLEKFMEMFQQFKTNNEVSTNKNVVTEDKTPPTLNVNVIKPVLISPYGPIHPSVIQTAVIPNQYNLMNIHPLHHIAPDNINHKEVAQLNIFNANNIQTSPITIQTNSVEVPPLGLPAQQSFVYQNIVVTTKNPFGKTKAVPYKSHGKVYDHKFDERFQENVPRVNYYREFGIGRNERSRELINKKYYNKHNRKPIKYKDFGRSSSNDHNIERFHEKLERGDDWSRIPKDRYISRESRNINDDYSNPRLITRHQLPLNGVKKLSRYDDEHFKNFLKTQQKVNDMLERILATKPNVTGPRSVETTVS